MKNLLAGIKVVNLAVNLPGPAAGRRLRKLGATVIKIEPPDGDPLFRSMPTWYEEMAEGQERIILNLKVSEDREKLNSKLEKADLLITATRPAALERLGLSWDKLHIKFPNLCHVAIIGYPPPSDDEPGHDLTYQAKMGLLTPPQMPRTLIADMAGAEIAVSEALALLLSRAHGQDAGFSMISLADAANYMGEPFRMGVTAPGALLGGGIPEYNIYETNDGWIAVAALEPHFKVAMENALNYRPKSSDELRPIFAKKSTAEWEKWAKEFDLPLAVVKH